MCVDMCLWHVDEFLKLELLSRAMQKRANVVDLNYCKN